MLRFAGARGSGSNPQFCPNNCSTCLRIYYNYIRREGDSPSSRKHPVCSLQAACAPFGASVRLNPRNAAPCGGTWLRFESPIFSHIIGLNLLKDLLQLYTERGGFEPPVPFRVHTTSNRAPSAARSSLQFFFLYHRYKNIFVTYVP